MNCSDVTDQSIDFLYGELDEAGRRAFELHLAGCDDCRQELEALGRTLGVARSVLAANLEPAPAKLKAEIENLAAVAARGGGRLRTIGAPVIPEDVGGLWGLLRRPWFIPAFAAASVIGLFLATRESFLPRSADMAGPGPPMATAPAPAAPVPVAPVPAPALPAPPPAKTAPAAEAAVEAKEEAPRAPTHRARDDAEGFAQPPPAAPASETAGALGALSAKKRAREAVASARPIGGKASAPASAPGAAASPAAGPSAFATAHETEPGEIEISDGAGSVGPRRRAAPSGATPEARRALLAVRDADRRASAEPLGEVVKRLSQKALVELGGRFLSEGRVDEAALVYGTLLERFPRDPEARGWKSRLAEARAAMTARMPAAPPPAPAAAPSR